MRLRNLILGTSVLLVIASVPTVAYAINARIKVNGSVVAEALEVGSCLVPAGGTSCSVTSPINQVSETEGVVFILPGGVAEATAVANNTNGEGDVPGIINSVSVHDLVIQYLGPLTPGTIEITYGNRFRLPDAVWTAAGSGGFDCDRTTLIPSIPGTAICRNYGYTSTGSFCRVDPISFACLTADPDTVTMTGEITFEKAGATAKAPIGPPISYRVDSGGSGNNDFFPLAKVAVADQNVACDPLFELEGFCVAAETQTSTLVFTLNPGDAVFLIASPEYLGGPSEAAVLNRLKSKSPEIDVQPIYDPNNNDLNLDSKGMRSVAVIASATFDPTTIVPGSVLLSAGGGSGVPPVGAPLFRDVNKDGLTDAVFKFSIPALAANGGSCRPTVAVPLAVPVAVLKATATFTSTFTQQVGGTPQTVTVTENLPFSGSQTFTCAPKAGR